MSILAADVGTTGMKMGIFREEEGGIRLHRKYSRGYEVNVYNNGLFADIEQGKWQEAFVAGCREFGDLCRDVEVVSLSGTTPGLTAMSGTGEALYPAVLMLDQRSRSQAQRIIDTIGLETLLETTGNMPVAGGCSLAGILWIRENLPDIFGKTAVFGHSNTFMARWLTGRAAIDPSSASLTALYNTVRNDFTWNKEIAGAFGLSPDRLPEVVHADESAGRVGEILSETLGLRKRPDVLIGGNDAVLAAFSAGIGEPGDVMNVNGTCEITLVCLPRCIPSIRYNIRAHVVPERWLTLYVMNAGGKALEWFHRTICREMSEEAFHNRFIPGALAEWIENDRGATYIPFLMGSRYSQEQLTAEFRGLTQETCREELLAAMVRGLCAYQREHLDEIARAVPLQPKIHVTGGALNPQVIRAKKHWMRDCEYVHSEESSLHGAALLGKQFLSR